LFYQLQGAFNPKKRCLYWFRQPTPWPNQTENTLEEIAVFDAARLVRETLSVLASGFIIATLRFVFGLRQAQFLRSFGAL
jgi:hypothetical protein